ncbi:MAG: isoamylase [Pirellulaceae bacterium]|nr:isoamylase [Pirellulaceae bacterium]
MMNRWEKLEGSPFPMGVTWIADEHSFNFSLYSKHAEAVRLLLYSPGDLIYPVYEYDFDFLKNKSGPVWHCRINRQDIADAGYYAYRVDGPAPERGFNWHHFDFEKILLDPYAKAVFIPDNFSRESACQPGSNAGKAPLGILPFEECVFDWGDDLSPRHDWNLVIYEMHVRGFTRNPNSGIESSRQGTFLGIVDKIPYLKELGVTAVELMPVFQFDPDEKNYWGYMPLSFFAPHQGYATELHACQQRAEFRTMVKSLHAAGIEVILDVVYNHTCEGNSQGPTYSLKGIDSSTAYVMTGNPKAPFANFSGTGNTLHTANRAIRRMILDSLCYWENEMHVDGFRFDLASIFTRNSDGSINTHDPPIISQIGMEPLLSNNRLIAEPWDADGAFQLGNKFPGQRWMQWNARYRDTLQRFVRGDAGLVGDLMIRLYGSDDLFPDDRIHAYQPTMSVNYITSHDGFTLYDLVTYSEKRNWANGHGNKDGAHEYSGNCGWEGEEGVPPEILRLRKRLVKNFVCLLMLSNGTPMFRMGDEFLQSQQGNNNPYNQDNETSWLDWGRLKQFEDVFRFFKLMIEFRKSHPLISRSRFWRSDVRWYGVGHMVDLSERSLQLAYCLHGASQNDTDIYVMINSADEAIDFGIHEGVVGQWQRIIDTARESPEDILDSFAAPVDNAIYSVSARSVVVLLRPNRQ